METLLVVAQHKNQYYSRVKPHGPGRFGSPSSTKGFRGINCRTFQSGSGILPTPSKNGSSTPVSKQACSRTTPSPTSGSQSDSKLLSKNTVKSTPIAINVKNSKREKNFNGSFSFSELWAGPAYSNSPPPSSLPIPKFSIRPKRTVSLELPSSASDIDMHPIAKSAPASPTREHGLSARDLFDNADSATRTLRRILNLDVDNE